MESNRQRKVAQIIQEDLAELFRKQSAQAGHNIIISVSEVKVTADLGIAKIYISIYPAKLRENLMNEIEIAKPTYRNYLGKKMGKQVRIIPELQFYLDTTLDDAEQIDRELKGLGDNPIL